MSSNNNTGNDNNLLSFLKNQSLFNGSPTRKMSSRSRDRKSERNRSPGANQQYSGNVSYTNQVNTNQVNGNYVDNNRVSTNYQAGNSGAVNGGVSLNLQGGNQAATQGGNYQTTTTTYNGGNLQGANIGVTGGNIGVSGGNIGVSGGNFGVSGGSVGVSGGNFGVTTGGNFQGGVSTNVNTQKVSSINTQGMNSNINIQGGNFQGGNMQSSSFQGGNFQGGIQGGVTTSGGYSTQVQGGNVTTTTTSNNFSGDALQNGLLATTVTLATNEKTYASSFESARVETAQRLEGLALKVKTEINNLNYKLEMFNSQMLSIVTQEYNEIKERIYQVIEESFRNSEGYIQEYMRVQEMKFA